MLGMTGRSLRPVVLVVTLAILIGINRASSPESGGWPGGISINPRATIAMVTWAHVLGAEAYVVDFDTHPDFSQARRVSTVAPSAVLTELQPATAYVVRVATWSPETNQTGWEVGQATFTTSGRPNQVAPPVPALSTDTPTSVSLKWESVGPGLQYEIAAGSSAQDRSHTRLVRTTDTTFVGVDPDVIAYYSLRVVDAAGVPVSEWTKPQAYRPAAKAPLRVASYNVKCNCRSRPGQSWKARRARVVETIREQRPDVLGVQEALQSKLGGTSRSQFDDLIARLGSPYKITNSYRYNCARPSNPRNCRPTDRGASGGTRIIYDSTRVELLDQGSVQLPTERRATVRRFLAWAVFRQRSTGRVFVFGNTHLDNSTRFSALRVKQTKVILDRLEALSSKGKKSVIMVGDFNTHKWIAGGNRPYDMMIDAGYADPLGNTYQSRYSAPGAIVEKRIATNFSSSNGFERMARKAPYINGTYLDYIFVSPMRVSEWETVVDVDSEGRFIGTIPSDHNMIRATVWLP